MLYVYYYGLGNKNPFITENNIKLRSSIFKVEMTGILTPLVTALIGNLATPLCSVVVSQPMHASYHSYFVSRKRFVLKLVNTFQRNLITTNSKERIFI